jgi:hypothetical protein
MNEKINEHFSSFEPSLGSHFKLSATRPSKNNLSYEVQPQRIRKIKISVHLSRPLRSDFKLSATRPS